MWNLPLSRYAAHEFEGWVTVAGLEVKKNIHSLMIPIPYSVNEVPSLV